MEWTNLVSGIFENIKNALPMVEILMYEDGVRYTFGYPGQPLGPGIHWHWPLIERIEAADITWRSAEFEGLPVVTKDRQPVSYNAFIRYRIRNVRKYFLQLQDDDGAEIIGNQAKSAFAHSLGTHSLDEILNEFDEKLAPDIRRQLKTDFRNWGCNIGDVGLTGFTNAKKAYQLIHVGKQGA